MKGRGREGGTGEWRKIHKEQLSDLQSPPSVIRVVKQKTMRYTRHVECLGNKGNVLRVMVEMAERNRPLGRVRRRWKTNIKLDLKGKSGRREQD